MTNTEFTLPGIIGLCQVHGDEFWVPHLGICPEPGCQEHLAGYFRIELIDEMVDRAAIACNEALVEYMNYGIGGQHALDFARRVLAAALNQTETP